MISLDAEAYETFFYPSDISLEASLPDVRRAILIYQFLHIGKVCFTDLHLVA